MLFQAFRLSVPASEFDVAYIWGVQAETVPILLAAGVVVFLESQCTRLDSMQCRTGEHLRRAPDIQAHYTKEEA